MSNVHESSLLPPAPPASYKPGGCLKFGLFGCGALVVLGILLVVAAMMWFNRNRGTFEEGAQEGARFGMVRDEAACFDEAKRRAAAATAVKDAFRVGPFFRGCLEYARETAGFCDDVPPPTSIGRTAAWQQHRCGDDGHCKNVLQVVQTYCLEGRPKRTTADTLLMRSGTRGAAGGGDTAGPGGGVPRGDSAAGTTQADTAAADSNSF